MYEYKIQKERFREDGYYIATVKVWDKENKLKKFRLEVVYGKRIPSERFKVAEIERRISMLDAQLDIQEPERIYTEQEITEILQEKGYLEDHEEFSENMPDTSNRPPKPIEEFPPEEPPPLIP